MSQRDVRRRADEVHGRLDGERVRRRVDDDARRSAPSCPAPSRRSASPSPEPASAKPLTTPPAGAASACATGTPSARRSVHADPARAAAPDLPGGDRGAGRGEVDRGLAGDARAPSSRRSAARTARSSAPASTLRCASPNAVAVSPDAVDRDGGRPGPTGGAASPAPSTIRGAPNAAASGDEVSGIVASMIRVPVRAGRRRRLLAEGDRALAEAGRVERELVGGGAQRRPFHVPGDTCVAIPALVPNSRRAQIAVDELVVGLLPREDAVAVASIVDPRRRAGGRQPQRGLALRLSGKPKPDH